MQLFTPIQYLKIDVASNFGLDRKTWDERISWFDAHEGKFEDLLLLAEAGKSTKDTLLSKAKEPAMFYAGLKAWQKASRGEPIAYPISLDATASGAQLMAVAVGCAKSALHCNVLDTGAREDFYTNMHHALCARLDNPGDISREKAKGAMVPWFYGSEREPKEAFGEGAQLMAFKDTMSEEAPGIDALRNGLMELWNAEALSHDWIMPDNFHVKIKVMDTMVEHVQFLNQDYAVTSKVNQPKERGISNAANVIHALDGMVVREMLRRCSYKADRMLALLDLLTTSQPLYMPTRIREQDTLVKTLWDHYQTSGFLSARILELLDEENLWLVDPEPIKALIATLPDKPFPVLAVHDCFRVHPNYGNDLRRQYNQVLHEIAKSDVLAFIASQISGQKEQVNKLQDIADRVLQAEYALS